MQKSKVFFRADGNSKIGLGHIYRSLALVEMLNDNFDCHFIIREPLPSIKDQLLTVCSEVIELPETNQNDTEALYITDTFLDEADIIVLDGYHFTTSYQRIIKSKGCKIVCIDDIHSYHFIADAVINHAGGISTTEYSAEPYTQFYLGLQYALLRKPFRLAAQKSEKRQVNKNVFICLGGADPHNDTLSVLKTCEKKPGIDTCYLIIGSAYLYKKSLNSFIKQSSLNVRLLYNLSATDMVKYMRKCSSAITSPSTISYEYLSVGGILYLKLIADNQKNIFDYLVSNKFAFDFNDGINFRSKAQNISSLDGFQQKRYSRLFTNLLLTYRNAVRNDMLTYLAWANDSEVRNQSYSTDEIQMESHKKWFLTKLQTRLSKMYVIELQQLPIGQIRFDIDLKKEESIISYNLGKTFRGRGLGEGILRTGIRAFKKEHANLTIIGYVKKNNIASIKAFRALQAREEETEIFNDSYCFTIDK